MLGLCALGALLAKVLLSVLAFLRVNKALRKMPHVAKGLVGWPALAKSPERLPHLMTEKANELGGEAAGEGGKITHRGRS